MPQTELRQRLTSILAADVVGYTRLMESDERATVTALEAARKVFRSNIETHQGRVIDMAGDAVLAVFESATGAVEAAIAIQQTLHRDAAELAVERRMCFRIGVHLGDVFEKPDGSIYGDGVNIAARLESLADASGIAVSAAVEGAVRGKIMLPIRYRGKHRVKNVELPVALYVIELPWQQGSSGYTSWRRRRKEVLLGCTVLALAVTVAATLLWSRSGVFSHDRGGPDETPPGSVGRSVAVLPFVDLSEAKNQSYFSEGLSEEVIGRLAQVPELRVIARTSSFSFRDSHASAAEIAHQLNVLTLLEGSVRRAGDRVRVTAQLVRASDSSYLWSGTYERKLTDIFAIQDEIANAVVTALQVKLARAPEAPRYVPKPDAYDNYLLGRQLLRSRADDYEKRAVEAFSRAVAIDGQYAAAYAGLAFTLSFVAESEPDPDIRGPLMEKALATAEKAIAVGPSESDAFATRGFLRFETHWDCIGADADLRRAVQLDPNAGPTQTKYAYFLASVGRTEAALAIAHRIKETDPFFAPPWELEGQIAASRGDYGAAEDSFRHARSILQFDPDSGEQIALLALLKGQAERARSLFDRVRDPAHRDWGLALADHALGKPAESHSALQSFITRSPYEYYTLGSAYAWTGESDLAFAAFERAYATHDLGLQQILFDPLLTGVRHDPRYDNLVARMNLGTCGQRPS